MKAAARAITVGFTCLCVTTPLAAAQAAGFCAPGQEPHFTGGFEALYSELKIAKMGSPVECEHPDGTSGDTLQQTDKGLAFYRLNTNTPTFTNGSEHWALTANGLVYWTGDSIDPPDDAAPPPVSADTEIFQRALYVKRLQDTALGFIEVESSIDQLANQLRLRTITPASAASFTGGIENAAAMVTDHIRSAAPPDDLRDVHALYLAATDEFEAGAAEGIDGLRVNDQVTLQSASRHFALSRELVGRARATLGV